MKLRTLDKKNIHFLMILINLASSMLHIIQIDAAKSIVLEQQYIMTGEKDYQFQSMTVLQLKKQRA